MKRLTPLQWAVLLAYAHTLPRGAERDLVRQLVNESQPERCGPALVLAAAGGLTKDGKITATGKQAARTLLGRLAVGEVTP